MIDAAGTVKGSGLWPVSMLTTLLMNLCTVKAVVEVILQQHNLTS